MVHKKTKIRGIVDIIQKYGKELKKPEIRVWAHPIKGGDDYYYVFGSLKEAQGFVNMAKATQDKGLAKIERVESEPLIAYKGYEIRVPNFKKQFPKIKL